MQIISERVGGEATHTHTHTNKSPAAGTRPLIVGQSLRSPAVDRLPLHSDLKSLARPVVVVMLTKELIYRVSQAYGTLYATVQLRVVFNQIWGLS